MKSVRIFVSDPGSKVVERLGLRLGWTNPRDAFALYVTFLVNVSLERPTGVLDGLTPAQLARMAGYSGGPDPFLQVLLDAGVVCQPYQNLRHRRCPAIPRFRSADNPSAMLAVCGWEQRQGPALRNYFHDLNRGEGRSWRPAKKASPARRPAGRKSSVNSRAGRSTQDKDLGAAALQGAAGETAALQGGTPIRPAGRPAAPQGGERGITTYVPPPYRASVDQGNTPCRAAPEAPPSALQGGGHNSSVSNERPAGRNQGAESASPPCDTDSYGVGKKDTPGGSPPPAPPPLGGGGRGAGGAPLASREGDGPEKLSELFDRAIKRAARPWTASRWDAAWKKYLSHAKSKGLREPEALHLFEQANGPRPTGEKGEPHAA